METARLSFVLLVIAMANLATDITRWVLELARPPPLHESVPVQTHPSQREVSVQPADAREPDTWARAAMVQRYALTIRGIDVTYASDAKNTPVLSGHFLSAIFGQNPVV